MENSTERKIIRNLNPNVGPTDGVSYGRCYKFRFLGA